MIRHDPVILDLDGTLVDSSEMIIEAIELACARRGVKVPPHADLSACVGPPLEVGLPEVLGPVADIDGLIAEYRSIYVPLAAARTPPMAGARKTLSVLRGAGITLAVATYKPLDIARTILDAADMTGLLDAYEGTRSQDDRRAKKEIVLEVLNRTRPHRATPLYIGDHADDRIAAEAVGIDFIHFAGPGSWKDVRAAVFGLCGDDDGADDDAAAGQDGRRMKPFEVAQQESREDEHGQRL